ncbi:MAG: cysteine desulfurase [Fimbriimonadaceae bacterium]|nr:cysteine desulfurase [Fimbriimonadaceae bacterium]
MDVYLDHNATSPLDPAVASAMARFGQLDYANPSGSYPAARAVRAALEAAREQFAAALAVPPGEVVFTSGGTEALNHVLQAVALPALAGGGGHLVIGGVEHAAVRRCAGWLATLGCDVTLVRPQRTGLVPAAAVAAALRRETCLVALQAANNELGTLQPVAAVGETCRRAGVPLLVDAVQALGKVPLGEAVQAADFLAFSAHKVGGPKGSGALVVRRGRELAPLLHGGGQEGGLRSGTEHVAGAVGCALAAERAVARQPQVQQRWLLLRPELLEIAERLPLARVNGHGTATLANTVSLAFRGIEATALVEWLGRHGVAVSPGSACCAGRRSEVLEAIGLDEPALRGTIRLSMGPDTSLHELRAAREVILAGVAELADRPCEAGCPLPDRG